MAEIVPTVTAFSIAEYNNQLAKIGFSKRLHLDFTDGQLAPTQTINLIEAHWPEGAQVDLHVMYQKPTQHTETLISLKPNLVIVHAEASGDVAGLLGELKAVGIKTGVALLPQTTVEAAAKLLGAADHVLVFGGRLGYQGSELQTQHLSKIRQAKAIKPELEAGWDGGVNEANVKQVAEAGADVINVGGYLQQAKNPEQAYAKLEQIVKGVGSDRPGT